MTSNYRQAKVDLAKLVSGITSICHNSSSILLQREQNAELQSELTGKTKLIADLSRQNTELSRQASDISDQNSELSQHIAQLKLTTKEAINKANKRFLESLCTCFPVTDFIASCIELRGAYEALRIQSQASFALVNDARKTMESLEELRDEARTGLRGLSVLWIIIVVATRS
jgi:septal ring factor EnvC (AmiA/AmiB activator)